MLANRGFRVLVVTCTYPTQDGPMDADFVRAHAQAARTSGNDSVVLHLPEPRPGVKQRCRIEQETDEVLTAGFPTYRATRCNTRLPGGSLVGRLLSLWGGFQHIVKTGFRPDIIHAHIYNAGVCAVLMGALSRLPVVVTEHFSGFRRKLLSRRQMWLARLAFRGARCVMPVSRALQRTLEECGMRANYQVVPNPVDMDMFHPAATPLRGEGKKILVACFLDPSHNKGIPTLLSALARLAVVRSDWSLDVVGDGPARMEYESIATSLGLSGKVFFHGHKSRPEVAEFMRQSDICVVSSYVETFSTVAAEALSTGTPVLATRCGGPEDFVNDEVGMLVPSGNVEALFGGLDYMLDHLDRYSPERISSYAQERFSYQRVGLELHRIYSECVNERKR